METDQHFDIVCGLKRSRNTQNLQMCRDNDGFPPPGRCRLSYQAWPIPRIVRSVGRSGLRGPEVRFIFDPAETT
jgi:hypothetical protein